jgi:TolB-like protein/DNA-binding winged helix-turn-helix (wHTH) protein/Flp pilus assembly protein TadD
MPADIQTGKPRLDLSRYELSVDGQRVKLERQPMELLIFFVLRRGQLVTREDIIEKLWGQDVFVDADHGINSTIRKIRHALKDDHASPKCLETVVGKGYRFIGEVELIGEPSPGTAAQAGVGESQAAVTRAPARNRVLSFGVILILVVLLAAGVWGWFRLRPKADSQGSEIHSIAVLPLANLSGDPSQDYFADGMTEELTTDLGKISSLKVISRTSAQKYRSSNSSAPQIARELNVEAIVEGSVLRSGSRVRITTQLIDAIHDRHLWAESYERDLNDALAVQSTVALEIARQVRIRLTSAEQQSLKQRPPVNSEAYDAYLKGRYSQTTQTREGLKEGLAAFRQSIDLDPTYAPAYAGLADSYSLLANYQVLAPREAFPQAEAAARKSLELDPNLADAHTALAYPQHHYSWEWNAAEQEYRTAISLRPSFSTAHLRYAEYLSSVGRHDEAIAEMRRALELDPLSLLYMGNLGRFLYHARRYDEAIEVLQRTLELDPNRAYARLVLAMCFEEKGMYDQSLKEFQRFTAAIGGKPGPGVAHLLARSGQSGKARDLARNLRSEAGDSDWFFLAGVYAALKNNDEAFACLQKAYEKHDFFLVFLKVHPYMDPLRSDGRFQDLVRRLGLPPQ